jgi:hypothetical protein
MIIFDWIDWIYLKFASLPWSRFHTKVPIFESVGPIYELRLMMDFSQSNRGYLFVRYTNPADARRAVKELNNFEIR